MKAQFARTYYNTGRREVRVATDGPVPAFEDFVFKAHALDDGDTLYVGECGDFVQFFAHDPARPYGYAGRVFDLRMEDGSVKSIKGPWSSRAGVVHAVVPGLRIVECDGDYITLHVKVEALQALGIAFSREDMHGETYWRPHDTPVVV